MHVVVGSEHPAKIEAVERTLLRFDPTVGAVVVDSGVSEQPRSIGETITGAKNRAQHALEQEDGDYGVGLEGGVTTLPETSHTSLIMWAAVTDGERIGTGGGPSIPLPSRIDHRLEMGEELGPILESEFEGLHDVTDRGAIGVLTDGLTDRATALGQAVACAFGPFVTSYYEGPDWPTR